MIKIIINLILIISYMRIIIVYRKVLTDCIVREEGIDSEWENLFASMRKTKPQVQVSVRFFT